MIAPSAARAILWDLDGVIVSSGRYHYLAYREVLTPLGRDLSEEEYLTTLFGRRNDDILRSVLGPLREQEIGQLAAAKEAAFRRLVQGRIRPLPGAVDLLRRAREAGLGQAIVSSTPRANIDLIAATLGIGGLLDVIVGEEDVSRGKPDPQGFLLAAQRLGVTPRQCVVIEDAPEGIVAGRAAGARTIAVATTRPPSAFAGPAAADLVVADLRDRRLWPFIHGAG